MLVSCNSGFSGGGVVSCNDGSFNTVVCSALGCSSTEVPHSDHDGSGSISGSTGNTVLVTCSSGYNGGGMATCGSDGSFNTLTCSANSCVATEVANSDYGLSGSITGTTGQVIHVTCDKGYSGGGNAFCSSDGMFSSVVCNVVQTSIPTEATSTPVSTDPPTSNPTDIPNDTQGSSQEGQEIGDAFGSQSEANLLPVFDGIAESTGLSNVLVMCLGIFLVLFIFVCICVCTWKIKQQKSRSSHLNMLRRNQRQSMEFDSVALANLAIIPGNEIVSSRKNASHPHLEKSLNTSHKVDVSLISSQPVLPKPTLIPSLPKLPIGWKELTTENKEVYYWNTETNETSWTHPAKLESNIWDVI